MLMERAGRNELNDVSGEGDDGIREQDVDVAGRNRPAATRDKTRLGSQIGSQSDFCNINNVQGNKEGNQQGFRCDETKE
ncbi:hypothetical protein SKAU_G00036350 [Synaphobranchus kaupii]|uniref:Uncharacterized protein n=1 Tax=Synaphobranchus kaupii TaxID=118154 RepID=A0A9Q1JGP7_SYNKA|nr:hypothetical protein SKAU_G00036350 [Synaphobranchus kaupii]